MGGWWCVWGVGDSGVCMGVCAGGHGDGGVYVGWYDMIVMIVSVREEDGVRWVDDIYERICVPV